MTSSQADAILRPLRRRVRATAGFAVEVDKGAITYPEGVPPADQLSAWDLAWYTCNAQFTPDSDYMQDWTEDQIGLVPAT